MSQATEEGTLGLAYLGTLPGRAKLVQEVCNLIGFICVLASGITITGVFYLLLALGGLILTGFLLVFYLTSLVTKIQSPPWPTIELGYLIIWGCLYAIFSFIIIISVSPGLIIAGIVGFIAVAAYLVNAYSLYRNAT